MTSMDIRNMSEDDLLDMDYFLNEDNLFDDDTDLEDVKTFYTSLVIKQIIFI